MKSGAFREDNAELITLQIFGMCNWAWTWLRRDRQWPVNEIVRTWSATILSGLAVRPTAEMNIDPERIVRLVEGIMAEAAAELPSSNGS